MTVHIALWAVVGLLIGCQDRTQHENPPRITAAVSIPPQAWLVKSIGGEHVDVMTLVEGGESPATYQPTDVQVSRLMRCDVLFRIGAPFEDGPWFNAIAGAERLEIIDTRQGITLRPMHHEHSGDIDHSASDPHIWLSPRLLKIQAATIVRALAQLAPEHAAQFDANLSVIEDELDETDREVRRLLAPLHGRAFFVYHPAWGYFAYEYGLRQIAIEIEGKEPTDHELTAFQRLARDEGVEVVFVQPQISISSAETVAAAIGGRVAVLDPLAPNVADNLVHVARAIVESCKQSRLHAE